MIFFVLSQQIIVLFHSVVFPPPLILTYTRSYWVIRLLKVVV